MLNFVESDSNRVETHCIPHIAVKSNVEVAGYCLGLGRRQGNLGGLHKQHSSELHDSHIIVDAVALFVEFSSRKQV